MIRRPPRSTQSRSSAASDVYKRQKGWPRRCNSYWSARWCAMPPSAFTILWYSLLKMASASFSLATFWRKPNSILARVPSFQRGGRTAPSSRPLKSLYFWMTWWIMYMIHQVIQKYKDFKGLEEGAVLPPLWKLGTRAKIEFGFRQKVAKLKLAEAIFKSEYHKIVNALGGIAHHLADQYELQRLGHPFYNSRAGGGEGHLEVAKNIYYSNKDLAHMVLSLKPFGCMPSTQSDGAQSAVVSNYKDMIYLPVETSGEGEINAHSRVQMALGEAKNKAKKEFAAALEETHLTLDQCRAWVEGNPESKRPLYRVPHKKGVVGGAAN